MADDEDVRVLGINDFYVADGYEEFVETCLKRGIFPLLNIEGIELNLSKKEIMENDAVNLLRERHIARRLKLMLSSKVTDQAKYEETLSALYNGKAAVTDSKNIAGTEEEMRSRLLKAGAPAFVPEDNDAFLPIEEIIKLIKAAGGIPTYPMLLDGAGAKMTEFENSKENLKTVIAGHGISSIELIPLRNDINVLKEYAEYFYENGFVVSFGTEHNTSAMNPITVSAKGGVELNKSLMNISFNGAAFQAAHQYLNTQNENDLQPESRDDMEILGKAVLQYYFDTFLQKK
jgi:hypothetical protein